MRMWHCLSATSLLIFVFRSTLPSTLSLEAFNFLFINEIITSMLRCRNYPALNVSCDGTRLHSQKRCSLVGGEIHHATLLKVKPDLGSNSFTIFLIAVCEICLVVVNVTSLSASPEKLNSFSVTASASFTKQSTR